MNTPLLFLAFANDPDAHLALLKDESTRLFSALSELERQDAIKIHREESAGIDEVIDRLIGYKDQVAIFHYGGHADGASLHLEGRTAHAAGLARLLGEQANLKLVFLNGCATRSQVEGLLAAGVKAVIATSVPVRDDKATEFATAFYKALANRRTIGGAFAIAEGLLKTMYGDVSDVGIVTMRNIEREDSTDVGGDLIPWGLYVQEAYEPEVLGWTIPPAAPAVRISVGEGLQLNHSEVGRVTGVRGPAPAGGVDVLKGSVITNTIIGDITGVEISPTSAQVPKP